MMSIKITINTRLSFLTIGFVAITMKLSIPTYNSPFLTYLITHLNNFNFPLNGGYFIAGSNQVGVFITAFL
jgi:hypothetical protein